MKKVYEKSVDIPDGVTIDIDEETVIVKHSGDEMKRTFARLPVNITVEDGQFKAFVKNPRKFQKAMTGTICGHVKNMIQGITEGFEYKLKIIYSHFPMDCKRQGDKFVLSNMYGERDTRTTNILPGVKVNIKGDDIILTGKNKEHVGQTAANIENITRIRGQRKKDQRIFQDGIYIYQKP